ncbi:MAG: thioredoxin [Oscillospiraceae bacterium]|nr:thioredoxin [Oscillospiraceae bacterium]
MVRTVLLIAAIVLIIAGLFNGSARDVFSKAVRICTECVGLG